MLARSDLKPGTRSVAFSRWIGLEAAGIAGLLGLPGNEAIGRSLDLIVPERLRQRHWEGYRRTMQTGKSPIQY
jgi:hypothetical protein